jgi:hypothetical protein
LLNSCDFSKFIFYTWCVFNNVSFVLIITNCFIVPVLCTCTWLNVSGPFNWPYFSLLSQILYLVCFYICILMFVFVCLTQ